MNCRSFSAVTMTGLILLSLYACTSGQPAPDGRKLNQIQMIGSHNSYKKAIDNNLLALLEAQNPNLAMSLDYSHIPLEDQLDLGLRNLEMDVFYDPEGNKYSDPLGQKLLSQQGLLAQAFDQIGVLSRPGLKMFHVQDIDFRSHHLIFSEGLRVLKAWSDNNADHMPIFITINAKDEKIPIPGFIEPLPFDKAALGSIDQEIREVLGEKLITPDMVRGKYVSLEQAIQRVGWPLLSDSRGRFIFVLDHRGQKMQDYIDGHPALENRAMFVNASEGMAEAAIFIMNEAKKDEQKIRQLVNRGYIVRTRADADTIEARNNDLSSFTAAKLSGAQVITTDYYLSDPRMDTNYQVIFDNGGYIREHPFLH
ncbi:MAG: phosphatidylinositol-specific phospholipase C1-like protein [Oceanicoccus sp.]